MSEERNRRIWEEIMRECKEYLASGDESIYQFIFRMERKGFLVNFATPTGKDGETDRQFVEAVIDHLNSKAGTAYMKNLSSSNAKLILSQRKLGFTLEKFITVIDKKCQDWLGTPYQSALTPAILFSRKKMENHLGQLPGVKLTDDGRTNRQGTAFGNLDDAIKAAQSEDI